MPLLIPGLEHLETDLLLGRNLLLKKERGNLPRDQAVVKMKTMIKRNVERVVIEAVKVVAVGNEKVAVEIAGLQIGAEIAEVAVEIAEVEVATEEVEIDTIEAIVEAVIEEIGVLTEVEVGAVVNAVVVPAPVIGMIGIVEKKEDVKMKEERDKMKKIDIRGN